MVYITYTMAAWDFADIYTCSPRACGPQAFGVYISKIPCSHGITITYVLTGIHLDRAKTNHSNSLLFVLNQIFDAAGADSIFYRHTLQ